MADGCETIVWLFTFLTFYAIPALCVTTAEVQVILSTDLDVRHDETGSLALASETKHTIVLVGRNFANGTEIAFTLFASERGVHCEDHAGLTNPFKVGDGQANDTTRKVIFELNRVNDPGQYNYICVKQEDFVNKKTSWIHQGQDPLVRFLVVEQTTTFLPLWLQVSLIAFLLCLSGLFSGLNLGLMALDKTELKIIERSGSASEKKYAKVISPLRKKGNFLLCTLLLGNVLVNNSLTILLDNITNGLIAVIGATVFIVVFGEIIPQAICSRHGLAVGAKTRFITYAFMIVTFPVSFPISKLLDLVLGEEIGQVYNREKLQELIKVTKDLKALDDNEVNIISGALTLTKKTVGDIMTRIEDVFMLEYNECVLNFDAMSEIMKRGYSRIPVYEKDKSNIVALLNIKDLALIDPDDNTQLKTVCKFYQHHLIFVFDDHKLDLMLQDFRQGHSHMAIVRQVNNEGDGDPYYETLGVVTLEDVIEEIIQSEIIDETDTLSDNIRKNPRMLPRQDFSVFNQPDDLNRQVLSPQLSMAAFQFLSTSVEPFQDKFISDIVLKKLIKQNIVVEIHPERHDESQAQFIYKEGKPCDYFILILQGHVEVTIGREDLTFQGGPFTYYGVNALKVNKHVLEPSTSTDSIYIKQEPYIPDFSVKAKENLLFLRIKRPHYIVARRATLMGRAKDIMLQDDEAFTKEWKHFSNLTDKCNHNDSDIKIEVHDSSCKDSRSNIAEPWVVSSGANLAGLSRRTDSRDSKDSGWSFPASDKQADTSESEHDTSLTKENKRDSTGLDVRVEIDEGEESVAYASPSGIQLDVEDADRTKGKKIPPADRMESVGFVASCDSTDFNDEELGSGEFTPLVSKQKAAGGGVSDS